jgi:hypothetical protein
MALRPHGRATVNPSSPRAFGVCDRCGFLYNLECLHFQYEWRGDKLTDTRLRVCDTCMDKPADFMKPLKLPADPEPVDQPRPENYFVANNATELWDDAGLFWNANALLWDEI